MYAGLPARSQEFKTARILSVSSCVNRRSTRLSILLCCVHLWRSQIKNFSFTGYQITLTMLRIAFYAQFCISISFLLECLKFRFLWCELLPVVTFIIIILALFCTKSAPLVLPRCSSKSIIDFYNLYFKDYSKATYRSTKENPLHGTATSASPNLILKGRSIHFSVKCWLSKDHF